MVVGDQSSGHQSIDALVDNVMKNANMFHAGSSADKTALETIFTKEIRPMLDAVDKIRTLGVTEENIQLPTIVVVGDQSSGKSSVLESLAGITLPRGQGIATRVPLVLRLQSCKSEAEAAITMEFDAAGVASAAATNSSSRKMTKIEIEGEEDIEANINAATDFLAGGNKNVRDAPISLLIRKPGAPDLTMVDLPGITRVAVAGQPPDIEQQIQRMIMHYITPNESIILNVISAQVDFSTSGSIKMSQQVDPEGKRTLAVVTKVDKAPEGLLEKVTTNAVNIGLGYVCVRNRTNQDDTIKIARQREKELFETHQDLINLDKSMVGIPTLAQKLMDIQGQMVKDCLPKIHKQMTAALVSRSHELDLLPKHIKDARDAGVAFSDVHNKRQRTLTQLIEEGNFFLYPEDKPLHYTARLYEKFMKFSSDLCAAGQRLVNKDRTEDIVELLSEHKGLALPDFLPHPVLLKLVQDQIDTIKYLCTDLVENTYDYATHVVLRVNDTYSTGYPHMDKCYKRLADEILGSSRKASMQFVERALEKVRTIIFTTNDYYMDTVEKMRTDMELPVKDQRNQNVNLGKGETIPLSEIVSFEEIADFNKKQHYKHAWRMKVSVAAYWKVVQKRLADEIPLEIRYSLQTAILKTLSDAMIGEAWAARKSLLALMEEDPRDSHKRVLLQKRVDVLQTSLNLVSKFMF